jgi:hypothetical protein
VIHVEENEAWYVLEGSMTFHCGERVIEAVRQTWVFAPRGVVHTFKVGADGTHALAFSFRAPRADGIRPSGGLAHLPGIWQAEGLPNAERASQDFGAIAL